jgi:dihydrofolate reductase
MTRVTEFKMIVAVCRGGGIGFEGQLPWPKLARDMRFFAEMTSSTMFPYNSAVVMGRKTWESIPASVRPLKFRDNFVVSALHDTAPTDRTDRTGATFIKNLSDIHDYAKNYDVVWFIGGASIYEQVLASPESFPINEIYITFVDETYEHDTAFPLMYQYESIEEWEALQNNPMNRAIWCWTDADSVPKYVSFFNVRSPATNVLYEITDVDRNIVSSITRTTDIRGIQERRLPDTRFLGAFRRTARSRPECVRPHTAVHNAQ